MEASLFPDAAAVVVAAAAASSGAVIDIGIVASFDLLRRLR